MEKLDFNLLKTLEAMFTHRSVSAAAATLGVTQPSVSLSLRRLRHHFRDELFVRQGAVMIPTAVAERLREPVGRAMATIRDEIAPAVPFEPLTADRRFVIGLSDLGDLVFLPDLIATLKHRAPLVSIRSVSAEPEELLRALSDGSTDLALGHLTDLDTHNCLEQTLFHQSFVCLVRADHPAIGDTLSMEQYLMAEHAVVSQAGRSQELFERRVRELGLERRVALYSPHFMSVPFLVAQSDMITVVPFAVGRIYAQLLHLKLLPAPFPVPIVQLKQIWHRRAHADPGNVWMRQLTAEQFSGRDPTQSANSPFWSGFLAQL